MTSTNTFRDTLRDPTLRQAWRMGRTQLRAWINTPECTLETPYQKRVFAGAPVRNALQYFLNAPHPKKEVMTFLLAAPALEEMDPVRIVETFGEPVAAIAAELALMENADVIHLSPLALEAAEATMGFMAYHFNQAPKGFPSVAGDIQKTLDEMHAMDDAHRARLEARGAEALTQLRYLVSMPVQGMRPN